MSESLKVLAPGPPSPAEAGLLALARFLGVASQTLDLGAVSTAEPLHLAATCEGLGQFLSEPASRRWLIDRLRDPGNSLFVTGFCESPESKLVLDTILPRSGIVVSRLPDGDIPYTTPSSSASGMPQFAGLSFGRADPSGDGVFMPTESMEGLTADVCVGGRPSYLRVARGGSGFHLVACRRVLDVGAPLSRGVHPVDAFLSFVPFVAYLRATFGDGCWTNSAPGACFIIDDPLLRQRYGFLELERLESHMAAERFSLNIAFIPWNCRRSDAAVVERFLRADGKFSLSIHGCDHTEAEFGATDEAFLRQACHLALTRMDEHRSHTGIQHQKVMVFPQGTFSKASLQALGDTGFEAAVNSTIWPVDARQDEVLVSDMMDVAVVRYPGVPLFLRHYPQRREVIALDVLLGRPVLMVEHHEFFRDGYDEFERVVKFVNTVAPRARWTDVGDVCSSATLLRRAASSAFEVKAFGSRVSLKNQCRGTARFTVRSEWPAARLAAVVSDDPLPSVEQDADDAVWHLDLAAGQEVQCQFSKTRRDVTIGELRRPAASRAKTFVRRHLSEVRDNYLSRSARFKDLAQQGKRFLPRM